jgi:3-deoxy-D-manno-octulosonic-acid transferase
VYRADIVVEWIDGTRNMAQLLAQRPLQPVEYQTLGRAIRQLHEHGVFHSDLNCHNLLLDESRQAWIVDFDKCEVRTGETWKEQNLARLLRSLRKERIRRSPFYWDETHWPLLLAGYEVEAIPST